MKCEECKYWKGEKKNTKHRRAAQCRRYPPIAKNERAFDRQFVYTRDDDWCGEFEAKK